MAGIAYLADESLPEFILTRKQSFPTHIAFFFCRNSRKIDICWDGTPRSVKGSEIFYSNQGTGSPICSAVASLDGCSVACVTASGRGFYFKLSTSDLIAPVKLGPGIVSVSFLDNMHLVIATKTSAIHRRDLSQSQSELVGVLDDCSVNSIDCKDGLIFLSTTSGFFVQRNPAYVEKVVNVNSYSSDYVAPFVYFMTSDGIYKCHVGGDSMPKLLVNLIGILKVLKSQIVPQAKILCFSDSVLLYNSTRIVSFSTVDGIANSYYSF
jgi:hypothetical protein